MKKVSFFAVLVLVQALLVNVAFAANKVTDFPDIQEKKWDWARDSIRWGAAIGAVSGYPDKTFRPQNNVTEAEFLVMLTGAYKIKLGAGSSKKWESKFYDYAGKMNWNLNGLKDAKVRHQPITRGQVAFIVNYAMGYNFEVESAAIENLYKYELSSGKTSKTIEGYAASDKLTRAQAVMFLENMSTVVKEVKPVEVEKEVVYEKVNVLDDTVLETALDAAIKNTTLKKEVMKEEPMSRFSGNYTQGSVEGSAFRIETSRPLNLTALIDIDGKQHGLMFPALKSIFGDRISNNEQEFMQQLMLYKYIEIGKNSISVALDHNAEYHKIGAVGFTLVIK